MPFLSYAAITDFPFQPFTKIYSADINGMFSAISTLLNVTLLDSLNIQTHGLNRLGSTSNLKAGTANFVIYNDTNGDLTEAAQLPIAQGGLGANLTPSGTLQAGQSIVVNAAGTGFQLSPAGGAVTNLYNFYNLGQGV